MWWKILIAGYSQIIYTEFCVLIKFHNKWPRNLVTAALNQRGKLGLPSYISWVLKVSLYPKRTSIHSAMFAKRNPHDRQTPASSMQPRKFKLLMLSVCLVLVTVPGWGGWFHYWLRPQQHLHTNSSYRNPMTQVFSIRTLVSVTSFCRCRTVQTTSDDKQRVTILQRPISIVPSMIFYTIGYFINFDYQFVAFTTLP